MPRYQRVRLENLPAVDCPCGTARRGFSDDPDRTVSMHIVDIRHDAQTHYHKRLTEVYYILAGEGVMELDGEHVPVSAGDAILIKPGCRHRACGELKILNVVVPTFDPDDEWFD